MNRMADCHTDRKNYANGMCHPCYDKNRYSENSDQWKARREKHREDRIEYDRKWIERNPGYQKKWHKENHEAQKEYKKKWRKDNLGHEKRRSAIDIQFKLSVNLRSRLYEALKKGYKSGSAVRDLGCSVKDLKSHLESKFESGMSWYNYGKWHIDHIIPLSSVDLTERKQLLKVCNYTNLQPLWAEDN